MSTVAHTDDPELTLAISASMVEFYATQREVITLAYYGQLSHTEIAAALDLPTGTVKGRMRLGLQKLRTGIEKDVALKNSNERILVDLLLLLIIALVILSLAGGAFLSPVVFLLLIVVVLLFLGPYRGRRSRI